MIHVCVYLTTYSVSFPNARHHAQNGCFNLASICVLCQHSTTFEFVAHQRHLLPTVVEIWNGGIGVRGISTDNNEV